MPNIVRIGDMTSGHGCFPPQNTLTGSMNVRINGIFVHRVSDMITPHCCGLACHPSQSATGSVTVKVNGLPLTRIGDLANCGSILVTGSPNVMNNDTVIAPKPVNIVKPPEYSNQAVADLTQVAGHEAAYDDEDSIGYIPTSQIKSYDNSNVLENPVTDSNSLTSSGNSAIKNINVNVKDRLINLIIAMNKNGITDHKEQAMFLAQLDHESMGFSRLVEGKYSADGVWALRGSTLSKYGLTREQLISEQSKFGKEKMYEYMYSDTYRNKGFKLGNTSVGDGIKYKGRGYIQLTGKSLYSEFSKYIKKDLLNSPELLETEEFAISTAIQYWITRKCKTPAMRGDVESTTKLINGGLNGLADRKKKYYDYLTDAENGRFEMKDGNPNMNNEKTTNTQQNITVDKKGLNKNVNTKLSEHFTIGQLSSLCIFPHTIKAQAGFTEEDIIYNLKCLCVNVLEKIWEKYPDFRINSAFRTFTVGKSQHEKGMAADLQWPNISNQEYLNKAKWIRENINYDQLLFEHGNAIWIHVSFDPYKKAQRKDCKTMFRGNFTNGLTLYYK